MKNYFVLTYVCYDTTSHKKAREPFGTFAERVARAYELAANDLLSNFVSISWMGTEVVWRKSKNELRSELWPGELPK